MAKIKINDVELYYELHGEGKPIVFINGWVAHTMVWYLILNDLKKDNTILIFDNRGSGRSDSPDTIYTIEQMTDDVISLIQKLNLEKPHIVGHSMGGAIAQTLAIKYPEYIDKLILSSTSSKFNSSFLLAGEVMIYLAEKKWPLDKQAQNIISWAYSSDFVENKENLQKTLEQIITNPYPPTLEGAKRQFEALKNFDLSQELENIQSPTLVLRGEKDIVCLSDETNHLVQNIPDASYFCIPKTGHDTYREKPKIFTKIVLDFFASS